MSYRELGTAVLSQVTRVHFDLPVGLTVNVTISKADAAYANPAAGATTATAIGGGQYYVDLAAGDFDTVGTLLVRGEKSTDATVYDVVAYQVGGVRSTATVTPISNTDYKYANIRLGSSTTCIQLDNTRTLVESGIIYQSATGYAITATAGNHTVRAGTIYTTGAGLLSNPSSTGAIKLLIEAGHILGPGTLVSLQGTTANDIVIKAALINSSTLVSFVAATAHVLTFAGPGRIIATGAGTANSGTVNFIDYLIAPTSGGSLTLTLSSGTWRFIGGGIVGTVAVSGTAVVEIGGGCVIEGSITLDTSGGATCRIAPDVVVTGTIDADVTSSLSPGCINDEAFDPAAKTAENAADVGDELDGPVSYLWRMFRKWRLRPGLVELRKRWLGTVHYRNDTNDADVATEEHTTAQATVSGVVQTTDTITTG